jgi:hypothetical protein
MEFFQTVMGKRFYEGTMPELVEQLRRLNSNLERKLEVKEKGFRAKYGSRFSSAGPNQANFPRAAGQVIIRHDPDHIDHLLGCAGEEGRPPSIHCEICGEDVAFVMPSEGQRSDIGSLAHEVSCDNCEWSGKLEELRDPPENCLWERLDPGSEVPAGECPACGAFAYLIRDEDKIKAIEDTMGPALNAMAGQPLWENDEIQFARLLCEIRANCDMEGFDKVLESMDISEESADQLWKRAEKVWETAKQTHCPP